MRRTRVALAAALALILAGCAAQQSAHLSTDSAGCAAPRTTVTPATADPGQEVAVRAAEMWDGCNDQGTPTTLPPLTQQQVTWQQVGEPTLLTVVDANPDTGLAQAQVFVPANAQKGTATVKLGVAVGATLTIR